MCRPPLRPRAAKGRAGQPEPDARMVRAPRAPRGSEPHKPRASHGYITCYLRASPLFGADHRVLLSRRRCKQAPGAGHQVVPPPSSGGERVDRTDRPPHRARSLRREQRGGGDDGYCMQHLIQIWGFRLQIPARESTHTARNPQAGWIAPSPLPPARAASSRFPFIPRGHPRCSRACPCTFRSRACIRQVCLGTS